MPTNKTRLLAEVRKGVITLTYAGAFLIRMTTPNHIRMLSVMMCFVYPSLISVCTPLRLSNDIVQASDP